MIFEILGWLFVIWLIGSAIYSTKFHLSNYLSRKQKIKNKGIGEVTDEAYEHLHKQVNWSLLIFMQIAKLAIAIFFVLSFVEIKI